MTVTLVIFFDDIDTLHKGLYQCYKHIWLCALCVFTEGQQPFFYFFNISDSVHLILLAVL